MHPALVNRQRILGPVVKLAPGGGPHVHQQIPAAGHRVHQHADQHFGGLPGGFIPVIAPGAREGLAGFPGDQLAGLGMTHPFGHLILLGGPQILLQLGAVVDNNVRLQGAGSGNQLFSLPVILALALHPFLARQGRMIGIGEIEPENINFSVIGKQLSHLIAHILGVDAHVPALIELLGIGIIAAGMEHVDGEMGMVPVNQGIVKANLQALSPECVHVFPHQIPARGGVGAFVIGELGIEHAKAFVMLGGEHGILHAGGLGGFGPGPGVIQIGIEMLEILLVFFFGDAFPVLDPFVPGRQRIQAPMNEHAETIRPEPFRVAGGFAGNIAAHMKFPP